MVQTTNSKKGIYMRQNPPSQSWQHMEIMQKNKENYLSHPVLWHSENCNLGSNNLSGNLTVANEINSFRILSKEDSRDSKTLQG
jgi:hypothetical protein